MSLAMILGIPSLHQAVERVTALYGKGAFTDLFRAWPLCKGADALAAENLFGELAEGFYESRIFRIDLRYLIRKKLEHLKSIATYWDSFPPFVEEDPEEGVHQGVGYGAGEVVEKHSLDVLHQTVAFDGLVVGFADKGRELFLSLFPLIVVKEHGFLQAIMKITSCLWRGHWPP